MSGPIAFAVASRSQERYLVETLDLGTESLEIFRLPARSDGCQRPAMECALEGNDPVALGRAVYIMIATRGLDRAFQRLGARIREEHLVCKGCVHKPLAQATLAGNLVEVGHMPQTCRLLGERGNQMRMAVAQRVHGDAAGEVEIALAAVRHQPASFTSVEGQGCASEGLVKRRTVHYMPRRLRRGECAK